MKTPTSQEDKALAKGYSQASQMDYQGNAQSISIFHFDVNNLYLKARR